MDLKLFLLVLFSNTFNTLDKLFLDTYEIGIVMETETERQRSKNEKVIVKLFSCMVCFL